MVPQWWLPGLEGLGEAARETDFVLLARWIAQSVGIALAIVLADLLAGAALLRLFRVRLAARLRLAVALLLGAGLSATIVFFTVDARWALAPALAGLWLLRTRRGRWFVFGGLAAFRPRGRWAVAFAPLLVLVVAGLMLPVLDYDSTMYHMAAARSYKDAKSVDYHPGIRFNALPHLGVILYLRHDLVAGDDTAVKLVNLEWAIMLLAALAHFAHRRRVRAAWAWRLLGISPLFWWTAQLEYADWALACSAGVATVLLVERSAPVWLCGIALGVAAATKMHGAVFAALAVVAFVAVRRDWRAAAPLAFGIALVNAPWWTRSYLATGSPIAPFLLIGEAETAQHFAVGTQYGTGRSPADLLLLPWNLIAQPAHVYLDATIHGPLPLALILAAVTLAARRRKPDRTIVLLGAVALAYTLFWFATSQVGRYLTAIHPVLVMLAIAAVRSAGLGSIALSAAATLAFAAGALSPNVVRFRALPPVTFAQKQTLLRNTLPYYAAARELNRLASPGDRVYLWFCEDARYYVAARAEGDWFGPFSYEWALPPDAPLDFASDRLARAGFRWILLDRERAKRNVRLYGEAFAASAFAERWRAAPPGLGLVYDDERYSVFRLD